MVHPSFIDGIPACQPSLTNGLPKGWWVGLQGRCMFSVLFPGFNFTLLDFFQTPDNSAPVLCHHPAQFESRNFAQWSLPPRYRCNEAWGETKRRYLPFQWPTHERVDSQKSFDRRLEPWSFWEERSRSKTYRECYFGEA